MNFNKCDIEEVKHMAMQKFLEAAQTPEKWKLPHGLSNTFTLGKFTLHVCNDRNYVILELGSERIFCHQYKESYFAYGETIDSDYEFKRKALKNLNADEQSRYNSIPEVIAANKILKYFDDKRVHEECLEQQKALQETCLAIQDELRNINPKWWQFWKN